MRILIVDDEPGVRTVIRRIAEQAGFEVEEAEDGEQALRAIRSRPPELVLCDVFRPGKDGLELIREVQAGFPAVRIIAMSGSGWPCGLDALFFADNPGSVATLAKPFSCRELQAALALAAEPVSPGNGYGNLPIRATA